MFCNTWTHWVFKAQATHCAIIDIPVTLMSRYTLTCQCLDICCLLYFLHTLHRWRTGVKQSSLLIKYFNHDLSLFTGILPHLFSCRSHVKQFLLLSKSFNNIHLNCSLYTWDPPQALEASDTIFHWRLVLWAFIQTSTSVTWKVCYSPWCFLLSAPNPNLYCR